MIKSTQQLIDNQYLDLITNIEQYFASSDIVIYADRNTLKQVTFNNKVFIVKSFKQPSKLNQFIYGFIRAPKAKRAYIYANKIAKFTPTTVAYKQTNNYGLLKQSYLVSRQFDNQFSMLDILLADINANDNKNIIEQFVNFTYALHKNHILHHDYWNGNILLKKLNQHNYLFNIVDINRMSFGKIDIHKRAKNLQRLVVSDTNLQFITTKYANLAGFNATEFHSLVLKYRLKIQQNKALKNKLKVFLGIKRQ